MRVNGLRALQAHTRMAHSDRKTTQHSRSGKRPKDQGRFARDAGTLVARCFSRLSAGMPNLL